WLNTHPGQKRMLLAKPGLIGMPAPRFSAAYRALTGTDPIAPEISAWWQHSDRARNIRTIISRSTLRTYLREGTWFKGGPVNTPQERIDFIDRIVLAIDNDNVEIGVTDVPLGDVNIRMTEDDVLMETTKHR